MKREKVAAALEQLAKAIREEDSDDSWSAVSAGGGEAAEQSVPVSEVVSEVQKGLEKLAIGGGAVGATQKRKEKVGAVAQPVAATASHVAYHPDVRHYIVLENSFDKSSVGYWVGPNPTTWRLLESRLKGGALKKSGARLRRVASELEARQVWEKAFPGVAMPVAQRLA